MTFRKLSPSEVEGERLEQVRELAAESGVGWADGYRPGSAGCHELLDRTALLSDMLERHLLSHPACVANAGWYMLAEQAAAALRDRTQDDDRQRGLIPT